MTENDTPTRASGLTTKGPSTTRQSGSLAPGDDLTIDTPLLRYLRAEYAKDLATGHERGVSVYSKAISDAVWEARYGPFEDQTAKSNK